MAKLDWNPETASYNIILTKIDGLYRVGFTRHNASGRELGAGYAPFDRRFALEQAVEWGKLQIAMEESESDEEWDALNAMSDELLRSVGRVPKKA